MQQQLGIFNTCKKQWIDKLMIRLQTDDKVKDDSKANYKWNIIEIVTHQLIHNILQQKVSFLD